MLSYQKGIVKTSVRHLVEFLLRTGSITTGSALSANPEAMLEGGRLHRKIQRTQKATYQSEVPLKMEWQEEGYILVLEGRADGIDRMKLEEENVIYVDEIKCVYRNIEEIEEADFLHLAQAKCYAYMYGHKHDLEKIGIQITYCHLETEEIKRIFSVYSMEELSLWFADLLDSYRMWASYYVAARKQRNESIKQLKFPFDFRPGQKKMTAIAYQAMESKKHIFFAGTNRCGKDNLHNLSSLERIRRRKGRKYFLSYGKDNYKNGGGRYDKAVKKTGIICISSNDYSQRKNLYSKRSAV